MRRVSYVMLFAVFISQVAVTSTQAHHATPKPVEQPVALITISTEPISQSAQTASNPVVRWEEPAVDGITITHDQSIFRLNAFDPTVDNTTGAGIRRVEIELYKADNTRLYRRIEWKPVYCAFGGDSPCLPIPEWLLKQLKPNNTYTIKARAVARSGRTSPWATRIFQLASGNSPDPDPDPEPPPIEWQTIHPTIIEPDDMQLINPLRGFHRWREQEYAPQPAPAPEAYDRFTWRTIEPERDRYDFSAIDKAIAQADRENRRFAFRIRAMVHKQGLAIPDYLIRGMPKGWWGDADNNGNSDTYIPDWNNPFFQERLNKLTAALGQRYNGDPRIAWVDIGMYGNWGEWHMWPFLDAYPQPNGAQKPSEAGKRAIIDAMARAFPNTQLIMGSEEPESLIYALENYPQMGWRRDSLGVAHFTDSTAWKRIRSNPEYWQLVSERWKQAPIITEFISPNDQYEPEVYELALQQALDYHVSLISNGNTLSWNSLSEEGREGMLALGKAAGYRYELQQITLPTSLSPGQRFSIIADWDNVGNAPTYEQWQIRYELRDSQRRVQWQQSSALDLGTVMPETEKTSIADSFMLPSDLSPGAYTFVMRIEDPQGHRQPMRIAITGGENGHHNLATLWVRLP